jgi:hypothetical protein
MMGVREHVNASLWFPKAGSFNQIASVIIFGNPLREGRERNAKDAVSEQK